MPPTSSAHFGAHTAARRAHPVILSLALLAVGCTGAQPRDEMEEFKREVYALAGIERWNATTIDQALSTRLIKTSDNGASTSLEAKSGRIAGHAINAVELRCLNYYPDECLLIVELAKPGPSASEFAKRFWPRTQPQLLGSHKLSVSWSQQEGRNEISISHGVDGTQIETVVIDRIRPHPHLTPEPAERPLPPLPPQPPTSPTDEDAQAPGEIIAPPDTEPTAPTDKSR